jgi:hypothetical protein
LASLTEAYPVDVDRIKASDMLLSPSLNIDMILGSRDNILTELSQVSTNL